MANTPKSPSLLCDEGPMNFESPIVSDLPFYEDPSNFQTPTSYSVFRCEGLNNLDDGTDSEEEDMEWEGEYFPVTQDDEEHVKALLDKEIKENVGRESSMVVSGDWIKEARKEAVKYIRGTSQRNRFRAQTAYMAIAYHDAILSGEVDMEEMKILRLAGVACIRLASRVEEKTPKILPKFPTTEYYYDFTYKELEKTESMVLKKLDWRMHILTPFAFTYYFVLKFSHNQPPASSLRDLTSKSEAIIFNAITTDTDSEKLMRHKPSTIAAAAALLIMYENLSKETMELKINALSLNAYLRTEEIWPMYNQLKTSSTPVP